MAGSDKRNVLFELLLYREIAVCRGNIKTVSVWAIATSWREAGRTENLEEDWKRTGGLASAATIASPMTSTSTVAQASPHSHPPAPATYIDSVHPSASRSLVAHVKPRSSQRVVQPTCTHPPRRFSDLHAQVPRLPTSAQAPLQAEHAAVSVSLPRDTIHIQ